MTHTHPLRVYYEDVDLAGIVYYANYLKYAERGRSEMVRALGVDQLDMKANGIVFVVRRVVADYLKPALYDDNLVVETVISSLKGATMVMDQRILRDGDVCFEARVTVACMSLGGKVTRFPAEIRQKLDIIKA
ncbi:MAG: tol-pal system-associated acyl-CoA thioesterase [Rhodobacteraceae bacterium]|nr:tol-pal system-associated acyl-CoA thioesterase [Paracoccaceae bacterium]